MLICLSELLLNTGMEKTFKVPVEMDNFKSKAGTYEFISKPDFDLSISGLGKNELHIEFHGEVSLGIPCDRCLDIVKVNIPVSISRDIDMDDQNGEEDDFDRDECIEDNNLDTEKLIFGEILVNLPMKVLCSENCKGICNRCGINLNKGTCDCDRQVLDPRMSVITDIFKNFKEV